MREQGEHEQGDLLSYISSGTPPEVVRRYASLRDLAQGSDFGDLDRNLVVLDTETTGLSFNHDELTQIAAARMERGVVTEWFVTFVNPGKEIPEDVVRLTNIHDEDVRDAPGPSEALGKLVEFVGDAKVVAHNADFDRTFVTRHPSGYPLLENTWIDSLDLARIVVPRMTSHRLLDLVRAFGAPLSTHRADSDVAATCAVFRILLAGVAAMPAALVREIASMATAEQWPTQVVFAHFAREHERRAGLGDEPDEVPPDLRFSVRGLRRARAGAAGAEPKEDADDIAADPGRDLVFPSDDDIARDFSPEGLVGGLYDDYEPREEQRRLAQAVSRAFSDSVNLMAEAGTGVGKSMAYLVPLARVARANNVTVGVATKTNALLDQLVSQELPALADALEAEDAEAGRAPRRLTWSALKGFSHYPCLLRVEQLTRDGAGMRAVGGKERSQAPALAALLSFIEQTDLDDVDALKIDYRLLPRRSFTTTSRECLRRACPFFGNGCLVLGARRRAEDADVVVTNHSLLFCDVVADGGLLPPVRYWVVDEAHGAEAEARRAFSRALDAEELLRAADRVDAQNASKGLFAKVERQAAGSLSDEGATLFYALSAKARAAAGEYGRAVRAFVPSLKDLLFFEPSKRNKGYETVELWVNDDVRSSFTFANVASLGADMAQAAERLARACQDLASSLEGLEGAAEAQRSLAACAADLEEQVGAVDLILTSPSQDCAYSATLCRKKDKVAERLEALPLNVGERLNETLYARTHAVAFTSATLSVDGRFDAFREAMGLGEGEFSEARSCLLSSSYDLDRQMTVYVAKDMPEPNDPKYLPALQRLLVDVHRAQGGSMLTLFTNRREMERCFEEVRPQLKEDGLWLVCQKWGVSTKGLRDDFLKDEHLSLFALKSFWEGFDAPGATLKGVVIPKLPFSKPTDPLSCERAARDDQAWRHYVLPAAVLETKQAAGRLIRRSDDTGVLILADRRLVSKGYGKAFLNSLPSRTVKVLTCAEIAAEIAASRPADDAVPAGGEGA